MAAAVCSAMVFSSFKLAEEYDAAGSACWQCDDADRPLACAQRSTHQGLQRALDSSARESAAQLFTISPIPRSSVEAAKRECRTERARLICGITT